MTLLAESTDRFSDTILAELADRFSRQDSLVTFDWQARGDVNDHHIDGKVLGVYGGKENVFRARMIFNDDPEVGSAYLLVSSCSIACICSCCINSHPVAGTANLLSVFDRHVRAEADYTIWDAPGKVIGSGTQICEADFHRSSTGVHCPATIDFQMQMDDPPKNYPFERVLNYSPGYIVYLRQVGPRFIEGNLSYPFFAEEGSTGVARGHVAAVRRYYYDTDRELPFPEIQSYYLRELSVTVQDGHRIIDFASSAYYLPMEPIPELELACATLAKSPSLPVN